MSRVSRLSLAAAYFCLAAAPVSPALAAPGYKLDRLNGLGHEVIYVSKDGALIDYPDAGFAVLSSAPDWHVTWYSRSGKTQFSTTLAAFRTEKGVSPKCPPPLKSPAPRTSYGGMKAFKDSASHEVFGKPGEFFGKVQGSRDVEISHIDFYYSEPLSLPLQDFQFLNSFFGTRNFAAIPLACERVATNGKVYKVWFTKAVERVDIPPTRFAIPPGCKKVSNHFSVASGVGYRDALDNLAEDMKVGEKFGHQK